MLRFLPKCDFANDNVDFWLEGRSDGLADKWSEQLANENGCWGTIYVAGWICGNELMLRGSTHSKANTGVQQPLEFRRFRLSTMTVVDSFGTGQSHS
jgi:hypothetical protein